MIKFKKFIFVIFLSLIYQTSFSQVFGGSGIVPGQLAWKIGLYGGPSFAFLTGSFKGQCDYLFTKGDGIGFYINLNATYPIDYYSDIYFSLGYQGNKIKSYAERYRPKVIYGEVDPVEVLMGSNLEIKFSSLNLDAYYKMKLYKNLYFLAGFGVFLTLSSEMKQDETIKDNRFEFLSNKKTDILYPTSSDPGTLENINSLMFSGRLGLGYDIYLDKKFILAPQVFLYYPFSKLTKDDSWKVINLNVGLQILYAL